MIVGTGIDIIEISRMEKALSRSEERLEEVLFTEKERAYCLKCANARLQVQRFSGRFAAKEAFLKALGTGLRDGISWTDLEIVNDDLGKPHLTATNIARDKLDALQVRAIHVSISHSIDHANAVVILET